MMRRILMVSASALAFAGSAAAADLPSRAPPPVFVPPAPVFSWTGFYLGGQIGYAWGQTNLNFNDSFGDLDQFSYQNSGVIGGAHAGYLMQINGCCMVAGVEGDVDGTSLTKSGSAFAPFGTALVGAGALDAPIPGNVTVQVNHNVEGSIRGRLGWALGALGWNRVLVYATGGVAFGGFNENVAATFADPASGTIIGGNANSSTTRVGWTVGGGLEYAMTDNWSLRAEYRYTDFGRSTIYDPLSVGGSGLVLDSSIDRHFTENRVQVGFSYKFAAAPPPPVVAKY